MHCKRQTGWADSRNVANAACYIPGAGKPVEGPGTTEIYGFCFIYERAIPLRSKYYTLLRADQLESRLHSTHKPNNLRQ